MTTPELFKLRSTKNGNEICAIHNGMLDAFMIVDDHKEASRYVNLLNESSINHGKI